MKLAPHYKFRLYVAGNGPHSTQAAINLHALCDEHLPGHHEIEIVDVLLFPQRALKDQVMLTPLLLKLAPAPIRKVIGSLSQRQPLMEALGIPIASQ